MESSWTFLGRDRKSTRLNSSHYNTSYAVFCLKKKHVSRSTLCRCDTRHGARRGSACASSTQHCSAHKRTPRTPPTFTFLSSCFPFFFNNTPPTGPYILTQHNPLRF